MAGPQSALDWLVQDPDHVATYFRLSAGVWRPQVNEQTPSAAWALCAGQGAAGISATRLSDLSGLAQQGTESCLVSLPVAVSEVSEICSLRRCTDLLLTVDHFVQAEQISKVTAEEDEEQPVFVLLQGSQAGPGIRPGPDALRLAQGIAGLTGVTVVGISISMADSEDSESLIRAAAPTQQLFRQAGISCDRVHVTADMSQLPSADGIATDYSVRGMFLRPENGNPHDLITAEVISRPSLDVVVIDVEHCSSDSAAAICLPDYPEARLSRWLDGCCVLIADGDAQRLAIGDVVRCRFVDDDC